MYADDVIYMNGLKLILSILIGFFRCFFIASGLKANLCKSTVLGVGVDNTDIARLNSILNCEPMSFLFAYLGLPIGVNMKLTRN